MPESVWDYPRPPRLEPCSRRIRVVHHGLVIADTSRSLRMLETSHPPTYYLPPEDVRLDLLEPAARASVCEWKGQAAYWNLKLPDAAAIQHVAWSYANPRAKYAALRDHLAFYASRVDACFVDDEQVTAQPGDFYGGWITSDVTGPFKGIPGSYGW
jgi:uncharacterized protein (DUF427 family)